MHEVALGRELKPSARMAGLIVVTLGFLSTAIPNFVSFQQAAKDFAELSKTKLTMPVLAIGGEKANGTVLGEQMKIVATNSTMIVSKTRVTGCWKSGQNRRPTRC